MFAIMPVVQLLPDLRSRHRGLIWIRTRFNVSYWWFDSNYMNVHEDKSHYLLSLCKYETVFLDIRQISVWESEK